MFVCCAAGKYCVARLSVYGSPMYIQCQKLTQVTKPPVNESVYIQLASVIYAIHSNYYRIAIFFRLK